MKGLQMFSDKGHSGVRAEPVSPEPKNTGLQARGWAGVHEFRSCPVGASRDDGVYRETIGAATGTDSEGT
jgi:hypothetical protein